MNCLNSMVLVTRSDKTSLIARKYTYLYKVIYLLFCVCYSNPVSFIAFLRIYCIHGEVCAKTIVFRKGVINFERLKINSNFLRQ